MCTPEREDLLREHAIEQIIQQLKQEFEAAHKPLPSQLALRTMAKKRLDDHPTEFKP